jgi:hypothetical protein
VRARFLSISRLVRRFVRRLLLSDLFSF